MAMAGIPCIAHEGPCLQQIWLQNNAFSGELPAAFGNLKNLYDLDVSNNELEGDLPSSLSALTSLQIVDFSRNRFTSLFSFERLQVLRRLRASSNALSGEMEPSICKLAELELLELSKNSLSGTINPCLKDNLMLTGCKIKEFNVTILSHYALQWI